jgi:DNA sulfur modification protein DndB
MDIISAPAIIFKQEGIEFFLCALKASTLTEISYVASRGQADEEGAVQRLLNPKRITGIKRFILAGGSFPNNVILNWSDRNKITSTENQISFAREQRQAQILDGQHRIAGLREAMKEDPLIGDRVIPTVVARGLTTEECAMIFVSINSEQRAVPKSLIYDLYSLIPNWQNRDFALERATDIARALNDDEDSPYQGLIKGPGQRTRGGIQLSTAIASIKKLVKTDGEFARYKQDTLDKQTKILKNFFSVLRETYGTSWDISKNPFIYSSGFSAAVELLSSSLLTECFAKKSYSEQTFRSLLQIPKDKIFWQEEVKGQGGDAAKEYIRQKLQEFVVTDPLSVDDIEY